MQGFRELLVNVLGSEPVDSLKVSFSGAPDMFFAPDSFKAALRLFPYLKDIDGKILNRGGLRFTITMWHLEEALVRRRLEDGVEKSVDALFEFMEQDYNPCVEVILLRGLKVPCSFQLLDNVFISDPEEVPSATLKAFLSKHAEGYGALDVMSPMLPVNYMPPVERPDSVLFRLTKLRPKFFDYGDKAHMEFDSDETNYLKRISELLTIISPSVVINRRGYSEFIEGSFLNGVGARSWESRFQDFGVGAVHVATLEELEDFKGTLATYLSLPSSCRDELDVPIHRFNEAVRHENLVDRAIDLGVAMESLLLANLDEKAQLSLLLRLRGAWLLGQSVAERQAIYSLLGKLYGHRSTAAHSGKLSKKVKQEELEVVLQKSLLLCARAIKEVIFRGGDLTSIFWQELLLGGNQQLDSDQLSIDKEE